MTFLLDQVFAFALLVATFLYIRSVGAVLRVLLPKAVVSERGLPLTTILYVSPTALVGLALYIAHVKGTVVWISLTAVYLSWAQDLIYVVGMTYYYFILRRIRRRPASFESRIELKAYSEWPSSDVVRRPLDYLLPRLPLIKSWKKPSVLIKPVDFERFLKNNTRLIDDAELGLLPLPYLEFCAVPHFPLPADGPKSARDSNGKDKVGSSNAASTSRPIIQSLFAVQPKESQSAAVRFHLMNRALHFELTEELWDTSQKLCRNMPGAIARTWKAFHFQQSIRMRYLALFNTADQFQRLLGAIALCRVRDQGFLSEGKLGEKDFKLPANPVQWPEAIQSALLIEGTGLDEFRSVLLKPRADFEQWQERLAPFAEVIGTRIVFPEGQRYLLAGFSVLAVLRNKIIGHGGIGSQLRMRPLVYLSALHYFFLDLIKDILELDIQVFAATPDGQRGLRDQSVALPLQLKGEHIPVARARSLAPLALHPYFRYQNSRLLIINRRTKEEVSFVDFEADVLEPKYLTFKVDANDFLMPSSVGSSPNPSVSSVQDP